MSPLPERLPDLDSYAPTVNSDHFFDDEIDPYSSWIWHATDLMIGRDYKVFLKSKGVHLENPFDKFETKGNFPEHQVFSTSKKGIYLEIIKPDEAHNFWGPKFIFHRYGRVLNEEYIASLTNG